MNEPHRSIGCRYSEATLSGSAQSSVGQSFTIRRTGRRLNRQNGTKSGRTARPDVRRDAELCRKLSAIPSGRCAALSRNERCIMNRFPRWQHIAISAEYQATRQSDVPVKNEWTSRPQPSGELFSRPAMHRETGRRTGHRPAPAPGRRFRGCGISESCR